ncbi:MAG: hypothetical protein LKI27_05115 [Actinomyces sp.]|jgi:hypothetical protein|nr:hypothetical protein [Actinomyces sp.]MCI1642870.1 hypothetical protein [Actinomyces sp.]MCI1662262.1 hypothetical protein [Actinomyces sp.]MCI1831295.1 hypothetical protein [Actinomyces sp.]
MSAQNRDVAAVVAVRVLDQAGAAHTVHQHLSVMRVADHANSGLRLDDSVSVPRRVVGGVSSISKLGMVGSAWPRWASIGRFQAIASCGRIVLSSMR